MPVMISVRKSRLKRNPSYKAQAFQYVKNILNDEDHFDYYLNHATKEYLILNRARVKVYGFALMGTSKNGRNRLELIGSKPGKGFGRKLTDAIYANAKKRAMTAVNAMNVVTGAERFYASTKHRPAPSTASRHRIWRRNVSPANATSRRQNTPERSVK